MRNLQKILSVILVFSLVLMTLPLTAFAQQKSNQPKVEGRYKKATNDEVFKQPQYKDETSLDGLGKATAAELGIAGKQVYNEFADGPRLIFLDPSAVIYYDTGSKELYYLDGCIVKGKPRPNRIALVPGPCPPIPIPEEKKPVLTADKRVSDQTQNSGLKQTLNTKYGNKLRYQISLQNTGLGIAKNAKFKDNLSTNDVSVTKESITISKGRRNMTTGDWEFGDLQPGEKLLILYDCSVLRKDGQFDNTIEFWADNHPIVYSTARVIVDKDQPPVEKKEAVLKITKGGRNLNEEAEEYTQTTAAEYKDIIGFRWIVQNIGKIDAVNIVIADNFGSGDLKVDLSKADLPAGVRRDGNKIIIALLKPNEVAEFTYRGEVKIKKGTIVNTVTAKGDNTSEVQASATVIVEKKEGWSLKKKVFVIGGIIAGVALVIYLLTRGGGKIRKTNDNPPRGHV